MNDDTDKILNNIPKNIEFTRQEVFEECVKIAIDDGTVEGERIARKIRSKANESH